MKATLTPVTRYRFFAVRRDVNANGLALKTAAVKYGYGLETVRDIMEAHSWPVYSEASAKTVAPQKAPKSKKPATARKAKQPSKKPRVTYDMAEMQLDNLSLAETCRSFSRENNELKLKVYSLEMKLARCRGVSRMDHLRRAIFGGGSN